MFKTKVTAPAQVATRRAQNVDEFLAHAIRQICEASPELAACYLLDMQRPGEPEMHFVIALTVDDEPGQMEAVAGRFLQLLQSEFPAQADRTFVMSAKSFAERYAGHEFYTRTQAPAALPADIVIPPVDLNQPVENPALVAALTAFAAEQTEQTRRELFQQLSGANFLVPFFPDEMQTSPGSRPGQQIFEKDSRLKIPACADRAGNDHLPLFTDWTAIRAWLDQPVSTLVMPAADAWAFILSQPHYAGAFINPGDARLQVSNDLIQYLQTLR